MRLLVPLAGIIDKDAEKTRLNKQRERIATDLARSKGKLGNEKFVNNAPADVVTQEKQRVAEFERQISQLDEQLERLDTLEP
jgi:valyl-tRNA synthetase